MRKNTLLEILPHFDLRWFRAHMGRFFSGRTSETGRGGPSPGNPPRPFGPLCRRLPGLNPHTILSTARSGRISRSGSIQGQFGFRGIRGGNRLRLWPLVPAAPFFLQQFFDTAPRPAGPGPGGILDPVTAVIVPLSTLTDISELAPKPLGSIVESTAQELFWGGCRPFLQTLFAGFFLLDFIDLHSPPEREKGPQTRPFSAKSCCVQLLHKLGGHQFIEPGVFRETVHKGHDGAAHYRALSFPRPLAGDFKRSRTAWRPLASLREMGVKMSVQSISPDWILPKICRAFSPLSRHSAACIISPG